MKLLKAYSVILLLLLYLLSSVQVDSIHNFFHRSEQPELHAAANEEDPCHQVIYHHDTNTDCRHKLHIASDDACNLCHLLLHNDHILFPNSSCEFIKSNSLVAERLISAQLNEIAVYLPSRAPPVV